MSGTRSHRSLAARRGRPYDKGRGFAAQALWVAVSTLIFTQVWCPNRLRCAILRWFGARIGDGVLIKHRVNVQWPWKLTIGNDSWVGTNADLYNLDDIVIGSDVCLSPYVYLCTGSHDRRSPTIRVRQRSDRHRRRRMVVRRCHRAAWCHRWREFGCRRHVAGLP